MTLIVVWKHKIWINLFSIQEILILYIYQQLSFSGSPKLINNVVHVTALIKKTFVFFFVQSRNFIIEKKVWSKTEGFEFWLWQKKEKRGKNQTIMWAAFSNSGYVIASLLLQAIMQEKATDNSEEKDS